jgi:pimeloyl-ACP methyl ester carboxylesterase
LSRKILFLPGFQKKPFDALKKAEAIKLFLENRGWRVEVSNYGNGQPMILPIEKYLEKVRSEVEQIKPGVIIAHSLGGIIARRLIEIERVEGVERLVMLESPHNGVSPWLLRIFGYPNWPVIRDIERGSEFLTRLNGFHKGIIPTAYCQIGGLLTAIAPGIFEIKGAHAKDFPRITHSGLRTEPSVLEEIARFVER